MYELVFVRMLVISKLLCETWPEVYFRSYLIRDESFVSLSRESSRSFTVILKRGAQTARFSHQDSSETWSNDIFRIFRARRLFWNSFCQVWEIPESVFRRFSYCRASGRCSCTPWPVFAPSAISRKSPREAPGMSDRHAMKRIAFLGFFRLLQTKIIRIIWIFRRRLVSLRLNSRSPRGSSKGAWEVSVRNTALSRRDDSFYRSLSTLTVFCTQPNTTKGVQSDRRRSFW